jgi:hypothetical protein
MTTVRPKRRIYLMKTPILSGWWRDKNNSGRTFWGKLIPVYKFRTYFLVIRANKQRNA